MHSRRHFLRSSGAALAWCGLAPLVRPAETRRNKVLVFVFLRGGVDGLNLIVPHGEAAYYDLRPGIGVPRPGQEGGALDLDGFFGLHPRAQALLPHFESGLGVALNAVGYPHNTRSHFEEQDFWETGVLEDRAHADGWLNRHLQTSQGYGPVRAVSFGDALPRVLRGEEQAFAVRGLAELSSGGSREAELAALARAYAGSPRVTSPAVTSPGVAEARGHLDQGGRAALDALRELGKVANLPYEPTVEYPGTPLARRFQDVARMIRADVGLEVAGLDFDGWDTHQNQGRSPGGPYSERLGELSGAIAAFLADLADRMDDVLVVAVSEFGRTAAQNGTSGTDHGWGNCVLAFGGPVLAAADSPRKVIGTWPGLEPEQLNQGRDLRHTTDLRNVLGEIASEHLGNDRLETLLPGHDFEPVGLI